MKKLLLSLVVFLFMTMISIAQTKKNGTPDMRYKVNKQTYGSSYSNYGSTSRSSNRSTSTTSYSNPVNYNNTNNYSQGGSYRVQSGYMKKNGTYVAPHLKTSPDNKRYNNKNYYK